MLDSQLKISADSDTVKFERFKYDYEYMKLQMEFNNCNQESQARNMAEFAKLIQNRYIDPYRNQYFMNSQP
jgi:hypothetical protein